MTEPTIKRRRLDSGENRSPVVEIKRLNMSLQTHCLNTIERMCIYRDIHVTDNNYDTFVIHLNTNFVHINQKELQQIFMNMKPPFSFGEPTEFTNRNLYLHYGSVDMIDQLKLINSIIDDELSKYDLMVDIYKIMDYDPNNVKILPNVPLFYKPIDTDDICMYCHTSLENSIYRLECGHYIHIECFEELAKHNKISGIINHIDIKCPYCVATIGIDNNITLSDKSIAVKITGDMIECEINAIAVKKYIMAIENLERIRIIVRMYKNGLNMLENIVKIELCDRSRIEEIEECLFNRIIELYNNELEDETEEWYEIWSNNQHSLIQPKLYNVIQNYLENKPHDHDVKHIDISNYLILRYTIYENKFEKWYTWIQEHIPDSPLLPPNPDKLLQKCLDEIGSEYPILSDQRCEQLKLLLDL